jgi:hypothetical protein
VRPEYRQQYPPTPASNYTGHSHVRSHSDAPYPAKKLTTAGSLQNGVPVLPTPDPTIASCISDEDVAMQLMRLGDPHMASGARTSTSTLDSTHVFPEHISPASANPVAEDRYTDTPDIHARKKQRLDAEGQTAIVSSQEDFTDEYDEDDVKDESYDDETFQVNGASTGAQDPDRSKLKAKSGKRASISKASQPKVKPLGPPVRKTAPSLISLAADEEDLSAKPRCQRCRKSKKGCDRQRPCQRCKDAGIPADGCISEDDSNGRKGRYGRHMGVAVKKQTPIPLPTAPLSVENSSVSPAPYVAESYPAMVEPFDPEGKKRKRSA